MSSEEFPQNVGQLRSKAYEFWKERENQRAPVSSANGAPRTLPGKPKNDRPQRPVLPPCKPGSSTAVIASAIKAGSKHPEVRETVESAIESKDETSYRPNANLAPLPIINKEQESSLLPVNFNKSSMPVLKAGQNSTWSSRSSDSTSSYGDASSYMPKGSKPIQQASSDKVKEHVKVAKSSSSPVGVVPPGVPEVKKLSSSWGRSSTLTGNAANVPLRPKRYIPRIETIRASTGDRLSKDDLDLLPVERTGRVMTLAKEINTSLLSPHPHQLLPPLQIDYQQQQQLMLPPATRKRPASTGEADMGVNGDVTSMKSSSPAASRRFAASMAVSPRSNTRSAVLNGTSTPTRGHEITARSWRSQSASKIRSGSTSVKIKSSGFISYLDGPVDAPLDAPQSSNSNSKPPRPTSPRPTSPPPVPPQPSPLHAMSNFLRDSNVPEGNHLHVMSCDSSEMADFWDMVRRLQSQRRGKSKDQGAMLTSPILSQTLQPMAGSPSVSRRHESICLSAARRTKDVVVVRVVEASSANIDKQPVEFTCNVKSLVYTVLSKAVDLLRKEWSITKSSQSCALKVRGKDEILEEKCLLCDYEYIHECRKFSTPVELVVVDKHRPSPTHLARRMHFPGTNSSSTSPTTPISPQSPPLSSPTYSPHVSKCLSIKEANYLLDGFHAKEDKFRTFLQSKQGPSSPFTIPTMVQSVVSCVKLLCERMSFIEPPEITDAVFNLRRACKAAAQPDIESSSLFSDDVTNSDRMSVISDNWVAVPDGHFCMSEDHVEDVQCGLDVLHNSVHRLVSLYCRSFLPGYTPKWEELPGQGSSSKTYISSYSDQLLRIKIAALHRPYLDEMQKFDALQLECCIYHGGKALSKKSYSPHAKLFRSFGHTVVWNKWVNMSLKLSSLSPESRVMFTLHGLEFPGSGIKWSRTPIAWTILRLFDCRGCLVRGGRVLGMWLGEDADPLDSPYHNMHNKKTMLLQVEFEDHGTDLYLTTPTSSQSSQSKSKLPGPPPNVTKTLVSLSKKDRFYNLTTADQKLLWSNRLACVSLLESYPRGLPVLLLAAKHSDVELSEVQYVVHQWKSTTPVNGLELLDPQFSSMIVREKAVECLSLLNDDDICDFLPQLVQSVQYDSSLSSPMVQFLLQRSSLSQRIAHGLFWNVRLALTTNVRFRDRYQPILDALNKLCGEEQQQEFSNQVELVEQLCAVAMAVKNTRDSHRQTTLVEELQSVADKFVGKFRLPLSPSLLVKSIDIESCSFFNSNTVPLKLSFTNADPFGDNISIIFKVGDDLRQDILILQMIRLMEKIWLRAGMDLKMVTYQCVATGKEEGMLEMVQEASTLRQIQMEHGVTGSFKDKPLSEWLQRHNPTESAYRQSVENFTLSCAGYCVATYVLGICDRHNDNIMVKKSGHMFHIDFGKILGNAQMFGNIRRDRAPFVLTRDMAYVINDGDKPTAKFQQFCDLCCSAYNELRKHAPLFVSLLSLILSSGLPEVTSLEDVRYVRDALLPDKSEPEATYAFTNVCSSVSGCHKLRSLIIVRLLLRGLPQQLIAGDGDVRGASQFADFNEAQAQNMQLKAEINRLNSTLNQVEAEKIYLESNHLEEKRSLYLELDKLMPKQNTKSKKEKAKDVSSTLQLQLDWISGPDLPVTMTGFIQSVQIDGVVYVGGGKTKRKQDDYIVWTYNTQFTQWHNLSPYKTSYFGMTTFNNKLLLVGGMAEHAASSELGEWQSYSKKWTQPFPPMSSPRVEPSTTSYKQWLVVAGGYAPFANGTFDGDCVLDTIEVLDTDINQWSGGRFTWEPWHGMKSTTIGNTWFLMGGYPIGEGYGVEVYGVSLEKLISCASSEYDDFDVHIWTCLPELTCARCGPLVVRGSLLAVGACDTYFDNFAVDPEPSVCSIMRYVPENKSWVVVGEPPCEVHSCTSIMISDKIVLIHNNHVFTSLVK